MVTSKGAQISINFLSMDIRTDSGEACLADFITLEDPSATSSSMIGKGKTFCGQKLPNYPGPSILVSSKHLYQEFIQAHYIFQVGIL